MYTERETDTVVGTPLAYIGLLLEKWEITLVLTAYIKSERDVNSLVLVM